MSKILLTIALLFAMASCTSLSISPLFSDVELIRSTVKVSLPVSSGSGVVVKQQGHLLFIVTNAHVVDDSSIVSIEFPFKHYQPEVGKVLKVDKDLDLALVVVNTGMHVPVFVGDLCVTKSNVYDEVIAVGSGLGLPIHPTKGHVSNPYLYVDIIGSYFVQHTAPIAPGNSGGPLFRKDWNGYCIAGVNARGAFQIGLAIPSNIIKAFIEDVI